MSPPTNHTYLSCIDVLHLPILVAITDRWQAHLFLAIALFVVGVNLVSVLVFWSYKQSIRSRFYLIGISGWDLVTALTAIYLYAIPMVMGYRSWLYSWLSRYVYALHQTSRIGSTWVLLFLTVRRYKVISKPLKYNSRHRTAKEGEQQAMLKVNIISALALIQGILVLNELEPVECVKNDVLLAAVQLSALRRHYYYRLFYTLIFGTVINSCVPHLFTLSMLAHITFIRWKSRAFRGKKSNQPSPLFTHSQAATVTALGDGVNSESSMQRKISSPFCETHSLRRDNQAKCPRTSREELVSRMSSNNSAGEETISELQEREKISEAAQFNQRRHPAFNRGRRNALSFTPSLPHYRRPNQARKLGFVQRNAASLEAPSGPLEFSCEQIVQNTIRPSPSRSATARANNYDDSILLCIAVKLLILGILDFIVEVDETEGYEDMFIRTINYSSTADGLRLASIFGGGLLGGLNFVLYLFKGERFRQHLAVLLHLRQPIVQSEGVTAALVITATTLHGFHVATRPKRSLLGVPAFKRQTSLYSDSSPQDPITST